MRFGVFSVLMLAPHCMLKRAPGENSASDAKLTLRAD